MAERINITNVPDQLYKALVREGEPRRETVAATVLRIVCDRLIPTPHGVDADTSSVHADTRPTQSRHRAEKFTPPSVEEARAEITAKGYHFGAEEFVAWNGTRGWKTRQGPMKDWRQAMVTWESRWREREVVEDRKRPLPMAEPVWQPEVNLGPEEREEMVKARARR